MHFSKLKIIINNFIKKLEVKPFKLFFAIGLDLVTRRAWKAWLQAFFPFFEFLTLLMMSGGPNDTVYFTTHQEGTFWQNLKKIEMGHVGDFFATFLEKFHWVAKMWSATMRYLLISSSESELYQDVSVFNPEREKTTKKKFKKKKKIRKLEVKPSNDHQLYFVRI